MPEDQILIAIGRLEGKVDSLIRSLGSHAETLAKHDTRSRSLEQGRAWILGASTVAGAVAGLVVKLVGGI